MAGVLVDSNVLIDVAQSDSPWHRWSAEQLARAGSRGSVCINQIIYAELAGYVDDVAVLDGLLDDMLLERSDLPWEAAALAGTAFVEYRRRGGSRTSTLPDFYIGAHALYAGFELLTRDVARYRTYFPEIRMIAPHLASEPHRS